MSGVYLIDNLKVSGQHVLQHLDGPPLQGLREEGVVCVGKGLGTDAPGLVPSKLLVVNQDAHELRNGHGRVGVI